jgi:endo-1,4-beta-xylanase
MDGGRMVTRRSALIGGGLGAATLLAGARPALASVLAPNAGAARGAVAGTTRGAAATAVGDPLWQLAAAKGILYGSSTATWQVQPDPDYAQLFAREAGILFTEDDLLWYRLRPSIDSGLDFSFGDQIIGFAEGNGQRVFGAHLAWDEGFGDGWTEDQLFSLPQQQARDLLFGTIQAEVSRYAGRVDAWSVANEVTDPMTSDPNGLRDNVPWYQTIGPSYVAESFQLAHAQDPAAILVLNEFGFETGQSAASRRATVLQVIDFLLGQGVPVHALGIQAHLQWRNFARQFNTTAYRNFLASVAARGLVIMITEMDVLDDGLKADPTTRDAGVADVYSRYLDVALDEPAVKVLMTFGLSDRYTWLQEDFPRRDGAERRPLPFDTNLQPKPAYDALVQAFANAPSRPALW